MLLADKGVDQRVEDFDAQPLEIHGFRRPWNSQSSDSQLFVGMLEVRNVLEDE